MTEVKRCSPCNKSIHYRCYKGNCACRCMIYEDTTKNKEEEPHQYSKESQQQFDDFMESWRKI